MTPDLLWRSTVTIFKPLSKTELISHVRKCRPISAVCLSTPRKEKSVWFGEWALRTDPPEKWLISPVAKEDQKIRLFKTANGLISFLSELGFSDATIPMEEGRKAMHCLSPSKEMTSARISTHASADFNSDILPANLFLLKQFGFVQVQAAHSLAEQGMLKMIDLRMHQDGQHPVRTDAVQLTVLGREIADELENKSTDLKAILSPNAVPEWSRAISLRYIEAKVAEGLYYQHLAHARLWLGS